MQSHPKKPASSPARHFYLDILFLTLVIGSLFFLFLGSRPLFVPDEGRYAEIAREMVSSGNFVTPRLNGIIYFEKPVLFYWLTAFMFKLTTVGIWAARSVNAVIGLLGCLLTYYTARTLYNRITGLLAACILATCLLYFIMAHMVSLDMTVTVFLSATLNLFLLGSHLKDRPQQKYYFYAASIFAALAVLTKGLIGIVFPALIIGAYTLMTRSVSSIKSWHLPTCFVLFLLVALPWHVMVQGQHPQFFHFYFIEQHFLRYTDQSIGHYEPIWFFIPYLLLGLAPWVVFLPQTFKMAYLDIKNKQDKNAWFFLLWASCVFLFFSFSKSKLIPYILPLFPALAVLIAHYVELRYYKKSDNDSSALKLLGSNRIISTILISTWIALVALMAYAPRLDTRTIQPLAAQLTPILKSNDIVITYNQYYQDLPFYLQRPVTILNWKNELTFGMSLQNTSERMINDATFWQLWKGKQRVFIIISGSEWLVLQQKYPNGIFHILGKTNTNLLISNQSSKY